MKRCCLVLFVVLAIGVNAGAITVPNGGFELVYKPGTTVTGNVSSGGWTEGVGPDAPIDSGQYEFSDGTTGDVADIPGWVGYDVDGWIAFGGTYGRDTTSGNGQGAVAAQGPYDGLQCYLANGGGWSNPAGGLIVSEAPLTKPAVPGPEPYVLSMWAKGGALPIVLVLLNDGVVVKPNAAETPVLSGAWQEVTRTYNSLPAGELKIVLGVARPLSPDFPGATGNQTKFDNVTFVPEPATMVLLGLGGLALLRRKP